MSLRLRLLNIGLRWFARPLLARALDPATSRKRFARVAKALRRPLFLMHLPGTLHRVTVRHRSDAHVILYFHGGAYLTGSPQTHVALAGRLASLTGLAVFLPEYRLAPEHLAPAAFQDAVAAHASPWPRAMAPRRSSWPGTAPVAVWRLPSYRISAAPVSRPPP